jgi:hypothetical protein
VKRGGNNREARSSPDRRWRLTGFGKMFLTLVTGCFVVGTAIQSGVLIGIGGGLLLVVAGGYFTSGPIAPALERDNYENVIEFDDLGNRIPRP